MIDGTDCLEKTQPFKWSTNRQGTFISVNSSANHSVTKERERGKGRVRKKESGESEAICLS